MLYSVLSVNSFNTLNFGVQFHVHLIHKQCFGIVSQTLYCGSRQVNNFLVLNLPCKGTCTVDGKNIGSS